MQRTETNWKQNTKRGWIKARADRGLTKREAFAELQPFVLSQTRPMVFSANPGPENRGGHRTPKAISEQLVDLKNEIGRVYAILGRSVTSDFESDDIDPTDETTDNDETTEEEEISTEDDSTEDDSTEEEEISTEDEPTEEKERPVKKGRKRTEEELNYFLRRVREIRKFCMDRERLTESLDTISMRPALAASKLIPAGIPADALLAAMVMHWPADAKADCSVTDFDFLSLSRAILDERGIRGVNGQDAHDMFGYALVLAECRQPIMLIGPMGNGKSHLAHQIADYLEYDYSEIPMTPGATRGDLLGRHTIGGLDKVIAAAALGNTEELTAIMEGGGAGFILSQCAALYSNGGVVNFEEIDAADPSTLIVLNNALAGSKLFNSSNGMTYPKSENFVAMSTANTFGLGANSQYTGRERLDAATIDRWRMGRIWIPLDESIEEKILRGLI